MGRNTGIPSPKCLARTRWVGLVVSNTELSFWQTAKVKWALEV
jgi:hypothetical protein